MQFLLMIYADESAVESAGNDEVARTLREYAAFTDALQRAGAYVGSNRLRETGAAKTIRVREGRSRVVDGPFTETKEQLGGYYLIDVPDLDAALSWAERCPGAAHGTVEVRPGLAIVTVA
jgi:hypothetical protein